MIVKVRLYAGLNKYVPGLGFGEPHILSLPPDAVVKTAIARLGIPRGLQLTCIVNGLVKDPYSPLEDGNELDVFPPVGGG